MRSSSSGSSTVRGLRSKRRTSFSSNRRPSSTARTFSAAVMTCLILLRARVVTTKFSQSRLGLCAPAVTISTISPLCNCVRNGTIRPLMRAPMQVWPTSVWMEYAKSTGVAPRGSAFTSPRGVNV